jgi:hypothetical protein
MPAALGHIRRWLDEAKAEFEHLIGHEDVKVQASARYALAKIDAVKGALAADAPKLADEAKADAADVVHTAETQGVVPAEHEAEGDVVTLTRDAVHDVADALADSARSPQQTTAVTAGEAAAAEQGHSA